jgi:hypothetical protein
MLSGRQPLPGWAFCIVYRFESHPWRRPMARPIGSADANDSEGQTGSPIYVFPGSVYAGMVQNATQSGQAVNTIVTTSRSDNQFPAGAHYEGGNS